jgi:tetratricopeptide (TPR) repeat protein
MCDAQTWLTRLKAQQNDPDANDYTWFIQHSTDIYQSLHACLKPKRPSRKTLKVILSLLTQLRDYIPADIELRRWEPLLLKAVQRLEQEDTRPEGRAALLGIVGQIHVILAEVDEARETYGQMQQIAETHHLPGQQIEAIIGLLSLEAFGKPEVASPDMASQILAYHTPYRGPGQSMRLYQALAYAGNYWGDVETPLKYGGIAYQYWKDRDNDVEMGRCAYALAVAYRRREDWDNAQHWLIKAAEHFSRTNYIWQYTTIHYEMGAQLMLMQQYEESEQWMRLALDEGRQLDDPRRLCRILHGLGLAITYNRSDQRQAKDALREATTLACLLENRADLAHLHHTWGFMYHWYGDDRRALLWLYRGQRLYDSLPSSQYNLSRAQLTQNLINKILYGPDFDTMGPDGG